MQLVRLLVVNRKFLFFKCTDLKEPEVAQSSLRLIQQCLLDEDSKKTPLAQDSLDHLAANGVSHKSDKISMETMKLIPGIYVQNIEVSYSQIGQNIYLIQHFKKQEYLMPSPSAFSKFVLSVLKFLGILKILRYAQNFFCILK